jgi:hypothetical protein
VYTSVWCRGIGLRDKDGFPFGFGWGRDAEWYRSNPQRHRLNNGDGNTWWHSHNWDTTYTYLAEWLIPELKRLTPWLMNVTWDTAFSRDKGFFGTIFSPVRYVTACRTRGIFVGNYIDVGFFTDPADVDYFMVVNRTGIAEYDKPVRIYMEIDKEKGHEGHLYITDLYDMRVHDLRQVDGDPNNDYKFDMDFVPGQGRLYAISSDMAPAPRPPQLYAWWIPYKSSSSGPMGRINFGAPNTALWWAQLWWNFDKESWAFQSYEAYRDGWYYGPYGVPTPGMYSFWDTGKYDINTCIDTRAGDAYFPYYYISGQQGQWRLDASISKGGNNATLASNVVTRTAPSYPSNPGCPTLYVRTSGNLFAQCNSILPHSEFSASPAVDMLVLDAPPSTASGHYYLNISEDSTETSYFDNAKLWAVNHPQGSEVAVTTTGDILVYSDVVLPYTCYDENLVSRLEEMLDPSQTYTGATGGHLELSFPDYGWEHKALFVYTGAVSEQASPQKDNQALLSTMPDTSGNWIEQGSAFTRHNPTSYLVDVSSDTSGFYRLDCDGNNVNIGCVALVKLETTGWSKQAAQLDSAVRWKMNNGVWVSEIAGGIVVRDGNYVELKPTYQLVLRFDTLASDTLVRDFVLETYGYYDPADIGGGGQSSGEEMIPFGLETERIRPLERPSLIQYSVPYETAVRIFVYDIQGRLVSRLVDSRVPAGYHKVAWSDTDDANRKLGAGVYFVRMTASGFKDCKKVVLLKGD